MTQRDQLAIILAIIAFLNGIARIGTNLWFGLGWLVIGVLLTASYFSRPVREFTDRHQIEFMIITILICGIFGVRYYIRGNLEFALVFGFFIVFVGVLLMIQIWAKRTYPDF